MDQKPGTEGNCCEQQNRNGHENSAFMLFDFGKDVFRTGNRTSTDAVGGDRFRRIAGFCSRSTGSI